MFENVTTGTVVATIEAGDPDAADQGRLVYQSLTSPDGDSPFGFYQNSKQIKVTNSLNYEVIGFPRLREFPRLRARERGRLGARRSLRARGRARFASRRRIRRRTSSSRSCATSPG